MRKIFYYLFLIIIVVTIFIYKDNIVNYVTNNIIKQEKLEELSYNKYSNKNGEKV